MFLNSFFSFRKRGQMISMDVILGIMVFLLILSLFLWGWTFSISKQEESYRQNEMQMLLLQATSSLVETAGSPGNWHLLNVSFINSSSVTSLGLMSSPGIFDYDKIIALNSLYSNNSDLVMLELGLLGIRYDMSLDIFIANSSGLPSVATYSLGNISLDAKDVFSVERIGVLNSVSKNVTVLKMYLTYLGES